MMVNGEMVPRPPHGKTNFLRNSWLLWLAQLAVSGAALGLCVWFTTDYLKILTIGQKRFGLYPWTELFFHPIDANRLNYMALCLVFGLLGVSAYFLAGRKTVTWTKERTACASPTLLVLAITFSVVVFISVLLVPSLLLRCLASSIVALLPVLWLVPWAITSLLEQKALIRTISVVFVSALLIVISAEQFQLVRGPVFLMNEYARIYGETVVKGEQVNNKDFLNKLEEGDVNVVDYFVATSGNLGFLPINAGNQKTPQDIFALLRPFTNSDLESSQAYFRSILSAGTGAEVATLYGKTAASAPYLKQLNSLDIAALRQFSFSNYLENHHQAMDRGQINHVGHIINPLNEYELGKPLRDIYLQYGLGNTFLLKWVMGVFGGTSYQNYYKAYLFYTVYFLLFLLMSVYLFKDALFILGAFVIVPICFFLTGYVNYIVAPGIIPSIRLLDAPALVLFLTFLRRRRNLWYFSLSALCVLSAIAINTEFGLSLSFAFVAATTFYAIENGSGRSKCLWIAALSVIAAAFLAVWRASNVGTIGRLFPYFWNGMFSWPAYKIFIFLTIVYLVVSYLMLFSLKRSRSEWKYVYIFVFVYNQATLLYYYWSGLLNHLPPVLPFFWLQMFIMLYILKNLLFKEGIRAIKVERLVVMITACSLLLSLPSAVLFYREKNTFYRNFVEHRSYAWTFDNASLMTTIPTGIIQESVSLIRKYSATDHPAIFILSQYDGLLPFLSHRYSAMPFFDLTSYLFSEKEYNEAVNRIKLKKPQYLFVDADIDNPRELWNVLHKNDRFYALEEASRMSRYSLLQKIFGEIRTDYGKIEDGKLISVYGKKINPVQ